MRDGVAGWSVDAADEGCRLDAWLARTLKVGRARSKRWIEDGAVAVNGARAAKSLQLSVGDRVTVQGVAVEDGSPTPEPDAALAVVLSTPSMLVVNKPAGVACHPLRPNEGGTLSNALVGHFPELVGIGYGPREPGLVHRLDNDTSGLLVVGRTPSAFEQLRSSLKAERWNKKYLALVLGEPTARELVHSMAAKQTHRARVKLSEPGPDGPDRVLTLQLLSVQSVGEKLSLVEVSVSKAARHQVRAQLAFAGHPLAGDRLYGGPMLRAFDGEALAGHLLHASFLDVPAPEGRMRHQVSAPLPEGFSRWLRAENQNGI